MFKCLGFGFAMTKKQLLKINQLHSSLLLGLSTNIPTEKSPNYLCPK